GKNTRRLSVFCPAGAAAHSTRLARSGYLGYDGHTTFYPTGVVAALRQGLACLGVSGLPFFGLVNAVIGRHKTFRPCLAGWIVTRLCRRSGAALKQESGHQQRPLVPSDAWQGQERWLSGLRRAP